MIKKEFKNYNSKKSVKILLKILEDLSIEKIVLYGIGPETEILLNSVNEFNIVGLMDPNKKIENKFFYEKKILSEKNVIKIRPIIIIVSKEEKSRHNFF